MQKDEKVFLVDEGHELELGFVGESKKPIALQNKLIAKNDDQLYEEQRRYLCGCNAREG